MYLKDRTEQFRKIEKFKKGELLGEGSFGKVYQAFDEELGQLIAVKEIDLRRVSSHKQLESKISSFEREIQILSTLNHKNVIKYYGTRRTKQSFHIFLEYCIGGSIAKMLEIYSFFNETVIQKYTKQILEGLEYLHYHNIIHRDIKGANILVNRDGICKLSDFGEAKVIVEDLEFNKHNSFKGTLNWMAPESIRMEYSRYSDIWSLGCTIIEMATGQPPWPDHINPINTIYHLMNTNSPPDFPPHLSNTCKHFLECCLK